MKLPLFVAGLVLLGLVGCETTPRASVVDLPPLPKLLASDVPFPETVAGIARNQFTNYEREHPGLGYSMSYNDEGVTMTVYAYQGGIRIVSRAEDPGTTMNYLVPMLMLGQAQREIEAIAEQTSNFEILTKGDTRIVLAGDTLWMVASYDVLVDNIPSQTYIATALWQERTLKLRLTLDQAKWPDIPKFLDTVLLDLTNAFGLGPAESVRTITPEELKTHLGIKENQPEGTPVKAK